MKNVDLNNLTEKDFEIFSKDILSYKLNTNFRTFHGYKDGGIDAVSLSEDKKWIMQAKFFKESSWPTIMSKLKEEAVKVKRIKPERYFLFLHTEKVTAINYEKILQIFSPYLKKEDLYDTIIIKDILEETDAEFILDKWDKLWLPSPYFVSKFYEKFKKTNYHYEKSEIINESKIFVETSSYRKAYKQLESKNIILIHGEPGAGKTTLARRLALKYIIKGYDFIYENANGLQSIDQYLYDGKDKIILIDDFLGQTVLRLNSISDNKLYNIINYAKKHNNIKLILTTRTYIYNSAKLILEKFDDVSQRLGNLLIEVKEYTPYEKEQILYNHLYYNDILWSLEYLEIIRKKYYYDIIYNNNYTPRNIEKICEIIKEDKPDNVIQVISDYLNNPEHIWEHEYSKINKSEFGKYEKIILDLVSFSISDINEEKLMFEFKRYVDSKEYENDIFYKSVKELTEAFLKVSFDILGRKVYSILNPSMEDFIKNKLKKDEVKMRKYILTTDDLDILYNICIHFENDLNIKTIIKERINQILNNSDLYFIDKEKLYIIMKINKLDEDISLMKRIIDNSFEIRSNENAMFILNILLDHNKGEVYTYCLGKFKESELRETDGRFFIFSELIDMEEIELYFRVCKKIIKKKDSKHMMSIVEDLIDKLIDAVSMSAGEFLHDDIEEAFDLLKSGNSIYDIWDMYSRMEIEDIEVFKELYTQETLDYIIQTVLINVDLGIFEDDILEAHARYMLAKEKNGNIDEPELPYYEQLFDEEYENQEELINNYFRKNIVNPKTIKWLINNQSAWYVQDFIYENRDLKLFTNALNHLNMVPKNPCQLGDCIIKYLGDSNLLYTQNMEDIVKLTNRILANSIKTLQLHDEEDINYEVVLKLLEDGILNRYTNNSIAFSNGFYESYFAYQSIKLGVTSLKYYEKIFDDDNDILKIYNMISYDNLSKFNEEFVFYRLKKYIKNIKNKNDKMNVVKFLIRKLSPIVYVGDHFNDVTYKNELVFEYIGLNLIGTITDVDYKKIDNYFYKHLDKYKSKDFNNRYEINFTKVIQDPEAITVFGKLKIWDNMYKAYKKIINIQNERKDRDYYLYFEKNN